MPKNWGVVSCGKGGFLRGTIAQSWACTVGNLGMKLKMCRIERAVEGFGARQKSYFSLLIIPFTYWAFK